MVVPRDPPGQDHEDKRPRHQRLGLELDALTWPDIDGLAWVLDGLFEAGPVAAGGWGPSALSWGDLHHWARLTRTALTPEVARLLRQLSQTYVAALQASADPDQPPYWPSPEILDALRLQAERRTQAMSARLSALAHRTP